MLASTLLISPGPNPVTVLLCFGRVNCPGPTGPWKSDSGALVEGRRSRGCCVVAAAILRISTAEKLELLRGLGERCKDENVVGGRGLWDGYQPWPGRWGWRMTGRDSRVPCEGGEGRIGRAKGFSPNVVELDMQLDACAWSCPEWGKPRSSTQARHLTPPTTHHAFPPFCSPTHHLPPQFTI
jgi:hypothetical protein